MPKSERDEILTTLVCDILLTEFCGNEDSGWFGLSTSIRKTSRIFSAMLDELVMDSTLQSHLEVMRGRTLCSVCNTQ